MIIGITGKKRSGKDVCANYLKKQHGFSTYKFAGPIKDAVGNIFLWDDRWVNGEYKEVIDARWGISPRQAQQIMGTELFRERLPELVDSFRDTIGADIWVKRFQYWYEGLPAELNVVISDVRFLNEASIIKAMGGAIIKIEREGLESTDGHASEMEMNSIDPDYVLYNNTTVASLEMKMGFLYKDLVAGE